MRSLALATFFAIAAAAQNQVSPEKAASMKADLAGQIDAMKKQAQVMVDNVFSFGELGFQEFETSKYLTGAPRKGRIQNRARRSRHPDGVRRHLGAGKARDRARLRHR